jgi:hypothetical protein
MPDILHRVGIKTSSPDNVYKALTSIEALANWWTTDTRGEPNKPGGIVQFRFGPAGFDMKVSALNPSAHVQWEVIDGPEEWIGTKINWELYPDKEYVIVLFKHQGWKEPIEFMHHCSTKWAIFLMSLKKLVETGKGEPFPNDVKIDNWN